MKIAMIVAVVVVIGALQVASERYRGIYLIEDEPRTFLSGQGR